MDPQASCDETWLTRYSTTSPNLGNEVLQLDAPPNLQTVPITPRPSATLGDLQRVPAEMLHMILGFLDVQSFYRFMAVSSRAKLLAETTFLFQSLVKHVPALLVALGKTRLAKVYSLEELYAVLVAPECVSCGHFGAYISLTSCERACLDCLHRNMRFWSLPLAEVQATYGLTRKEVEQLPSLWTVKTGQHRPAMRRQRLINLRHAYDFGLQKHGSTDQMQEWVKQGGRAEKQLLCYKYWMGVGGGQENMLGWNSEESTQLFYKEQPPRNKHWGADVMRMPQLLAGSVMEHGIWCKACRSHSLTIAKIGPYLHGASYKYLYHNNERLTPETSARAEAAQRLELRAYTKPELLKHLRTCPGASASDRI